MAIRGNIVGIDSPDALEKALRAAYYLADEGLATAAYLALALGKPLLLEGAPGVGKTEAAKSIAAVLARRLIRLQCYEGIDASAALYEWNYPRQMLAIRQAGDQSIDIYGEPFLIERPMLAALRAPDSTVLLIDEIDRSDQEFEAFLLEFLSDFQISIPERGTLRAVERPVVILTSNRTRDLHEALRRRCVYHWIDYPTAEREARIVMMRASSVAEATARAVVAAVGKLRREPLSKAPGIAESVDWAEAATLLNRTGARWPDAFKRSIGVALKDEEDLAYISGRLDAHHRRGRGMSEADAAARRAAVPRLCFAPAGERLHDRAGADDRVSRRDLAPRPARSRGYPARGSRDARAAAGAPCRLQSRCSAFISSATRRRRSAKARTRRQSASRRSGGARTNRPKRTRSMKLARPRRAPRHWSSAGSAPPTASEALRRLGRERRPPPAAPAQLSPHARAARRRRRPPPDAARRRAQRRRGAEVGAAEAPASPAQNPAADRCLRLDEGAHGGEPAPCPCAGAGGAADRGLHFRHAAYAGDASRCGSSGANRRWRPRRRWSAIWTAARASATRLQAFLAVPRFAGYATRRRRC